MEIKQQADLGLVNEAGRIVGGHTMWGCRPEITADVAAILRAWLMALLVRRTPPGQITSHGARALLQPWWSWLVVFGHGDRRVHVGEHQKRMDGSISARLGLLHTRWSRRQQRDHAMTCRRLHSNSHGRRRHVYGIQRCCIPAAVGCPHPIYRIARPPIVRGRNVKDRWGAGPTSPGMARVRPTSGHVARGKRFRTDLPVSRAPPEATSRSGE